MIFCGKRANRDPAARVAGTSVADRAAAARSAVVAQQTADFAGIVVATAVPALAASAGLLSVSTLGTASLHAQAAETCPENSMPTISGHADDVSTLRRHC